MSHKLPVVSRYLDGVTEAFIDHGENGFLFSHKESFEDSVLELADNPALRQRVGAAARDSVCSRFDIHAIAARYLELYRELAGSTRTARPAEQPLLELSTVARNCAQLALRPVRHRPARPTLLLVIDTESEFVWSKGVAADHGAVRSIERLPEAQAIFERYGITPCYVLDYPVATGKVSSRIMRDLAGRGAEIGAHLQPWTTPPFVEPVDDLHAFPGNLPAWLQRKKLSHLCQAITHSVGVTPRIFKAGRYGIGAVTLRLLEEMGFLVDLSVAPGFNYTRESGPDFRDFGAEISWFGRDLLEIPTTSGFIGLLRKGGPALWRALDLPGLKQGHLRGILDRTELFSRVRLSPEGYSLKKMKALSRVLVERGSRYLTLSFHSSSLQPGFTPYCATESDVKHLLARVESYLEFFRDELGGVMTSPLVLHARAKQLEDEPG
jgi:teichuronic acid biosynthesis glycosyltransferase TuaC